MRSVVTAMLMVCLLAACGRPGKPEVAASGAAAASAAGRAAAASAPSLLVAAEDLRTLATRLQATGPVISGSLQPERRADLRAEVGALVQQVLKDNGDPVRSGDLLVRLDDSAIRDSLNSADEAVRAATQAFEQSERQVQRLKTLQLQGMTSLQALEDAEVRRNNAQSDLVAARARAATARQQLRRTEVRAPFDGVLSERSRIAAANFATEPCNAGVTCPPPTRAIATSAPVEFSETLTQKSRDGHREIRPTRLPAVAYQYAPRFLSTTARNSAIRT